MHQCPVRSVRAKPFWKRVPLIMLYMILLCCMPMTVFASGGNTGSEAEGIGVSMYDVSTALTAFANNVVGSNTNDKHNTHTLEEFTDNAVHAGDAGSVLGYGDADKGFYGYISSSTSQAATSTDYDALLSIGDNGKTYAYARYGRLLTDLGLDDTAPTADTGVRKIFGMFMRAVFALSAFVPQVFGLVLSILAFLNPFRFFIGGGSASFLASGGTDIKDQVIRGSSHTVDASMNQSAFSGLVTSTLGNEGVGGVASAAVSNFTNFLTEIYNICQTIGIYIVIPLLLAFLLWQVLVTGQSRFNRTSNASRALSFVKRVALMIIGVPLCGMLYTSTLDSLHDAVSYKNTSSQMAACTFVDFQSWVDSSRLAVPTGAMMVSVGQDDADGESITAAGSPSNDTVRMLRDTVLKINYSSGILAAESSLGIGATRPDGTQAQYSISGGIYDVDQGTLKAETMTTNEKRKIGSMLDRYSSGNFYQAAAFETGVNGQISAHLKNVLGSTPGTANAGSNVNTVHEMYDETNEVQDWMDREVPDNKAIMNGSNWSQFNIFSNGVLKADFSPAFDNGNPPTEDNAKSKITYGNATTGSMGGLNPATNGGLSSVSMYNYLSTKFDDTSIMTYSAERSTSEYTREAHYAVNLIGSGFLRTAYALNCIASLAVFVLIGFIYGFGMLVGNLKRGIKLMLTIPMAAAGLFKSMVQLVVYTVVMIAELLVTVFVYQVASDLIMLIATITESAVTKAANAATIVGGFTGVVGSLDLSELLYENTMVFVLGICMVSLLVIGLGCFVYQMRRVFLSVHEFVWQWITLHVGFAEFRPGMADVFAGYDSLYVWDTFRIPIPQYFDQKGGVPVCEC